MKILLTGATGYIGKRLLPTLLKGGYEVVCLVRNKNRFPSDGIYNHPNVALFEVDFLKDISAPDSLKDIDATYCLIHSMSSNVKDFGVNNDLR